MQRHPCQGISVPQRGDVTIWVWESVTLSNRVAYDSDVLAQVERFDRMRGALPPVRISDAYRKRAHEAVETRIALAGYRLAAILADVLSRAAAEDS